MHLDAAITEFFYSKDFTTDSARFYRRTLRAFETWARDQGIVDVEELTSPLLRRYIASLRERISPRSGQPITGVSQHGYANALRTFLNFCVREDWLGEHIPRRLEMPKQEKKVLHILSGAQIQMLFRSAESSTTPERDRAVLSLLVDCGLRVSEVCKLLLDDVHFHGYDAWLTIHGKGRKERQVPLGRKSRQALHRYIYSARDVPASERHALLGRRGPLTQAGIDKMLYLLRDAAGTQHFTGVRVSAHTCRHSFAVHFIQQGGDVFILSRLLGHESVSTTERYLRAFQSRDARMTSKSVLDNL